MDRIEVAAGIFWSSHRVTMRDIDRRYRESALL